MLGILGKKGGKKSQVRLKLDSFLSCNMRHYLSYYSISITLKLGLPVDLWMPNILMLVSITLTLMQGHSELAKATIQRCVLSATKQARSIKLATTVGNFLHDLGLDFANVYNLAIMLIVIFEGNVKTKYL